MFSKQNATLWFDTHTNVWWVRLVNQLAPVLICGVLFLLFMAVSWFFIVFLINPLSVEKIHIELNAGPIMVGFFLYFVTAVDYALIVGRIQTANPGIQARLTMNIFTCLGCFFGVTLVLFLWGFAKEVVWLIVPILIFAGSVMVKLAYEGADFFRDHTTIPYKLRMGMVGVLHTLHALTSGFTFWIPELGSPKVKRMPLWTLAKWSFLLPFIIGTDDLVGYMGAMTIYNVFGLLFGIYLADIVIDILIFLWPPLTEQLVENAVVAFLGALAFLYLAYRSYTEAFSMLHEVYHLTMPVMLWLGVVLVLLGSSYTIVHAKKL